MIDFREELNEEQYEVVSNGDGPCLVLAGAGSGKTRTITYRVAYLLQNEVQEENILLLTFTNKAAREMMERIRGLMNQPLLNLLGGTFHSIAVRFLRQYAPLIGYENCFTILDEDDAEGMITLAMRDEGIDIKSKIYPKPKQMLSIISFMRNAQMTLEQVIEARYQGYSKIKNVIERTAVQYSLKKKQSNSMDFDDLLEQFLLLLASNQDVKQMLAQKFNYILVDEYQDTNKIQSQIIHHLSSAHKNVLVVGDDAQSIYSFRAADINNILDFEKHYKNARVFRLQVNYRSALEILELANDVIRHNKKQYKKELRAINGNFQKPRLFAFQNQFEESDFIAGAIANLKRDNVSLDEIAVLFRATFHSQMLELELMKRGIPYDYRGGLRFFERAHIKDVLCFIRIYANIHDIIAWQRVLRMQTGIGDKTALKILTALKELNTITDVASYNLADGLSSRAKDGWQRLQNIFLAIINSSGKVNDIIDAIIDGGYKEYLEEKYANTSERMQDIEQLQTYGARVSSIEQFLTETSLSDEFSKGNKENKGKVVLSTIHQSKGLEWDSVFLMRLTQGGLPNERALFEAGGVEEERRLFYVAITRAKKRLTLTYPIVGGHDGMTMYEPSMFLSEIDPDLTENSDELDAVVVDNDENELEYVAETNNDWRKKSFLSSVDNLLN